MASPQLEEGYLKIVNRLFEEIYRCGLSGLQFRVLLSIIRHTYGYNRKSFELAIRFIAEDVRATFPKVSEALERLIRDNIVIVVKETDGHRGRELSVNKNFESWLLRTPDKGKTKPSLSGGKLCEMDEPGGEEFRFGKLQSSEMGNAESSVLGNKVNTIYKDNIKTNAAGSQSSLTSKGKDSQKRKCKNPYAICNLPECSDDLFYKGPYFYITQELKCEIKEKLKLEINDDVLKKEFYKMELWLDSADRKTKDFKRFIVNWLMKMRNSAYSNNGRISDSTCDYEFI